MLTLTDAVESGLPEEVEFAGFWIRAGAFVIDVALAMGAAILLALPVTLAAGAVAASSSTPPSPESFAAATQNYSVMVLMAVSWLYFTVAEASPWQATPGKKLLGLRVVTEDGLRVGFLRANGRYWLKAVSWLIAGIGFVMVGVTSRKQGLHDAMAGTFVIRP